MKKYIPRLIDEVIKNDLRLFGAIVISGPKWCGKTTTAKQVAASVISLQDKAQFERYSSIAAYDISLLLKGEVPLLIDEWQMIPEIWDSVRYNTDERGEKGQFILTGSVAIDRKNIKHSGAGRISLLEMRTMSLFESGNSNGAVRLGDLFSGPDDIRAVSTLTIEDVAGLIVRGGWPDTIGLSDTDAIRVIGSYCRTIDETMVNDGNRNRVDKKRMVALMKSLSRNTATQVSMSTIIADISEHDSIDIGLTMLKEYLTTLGNIFVTDDMEAWCPNLRSKTAIRTKDTRYLTDPAIAAHYLHAGVKDILYDPKTFGFLFETLAVRDLRVYAQTLGGTVLHYRDADGLEVDAIIHLENGDWGAVEIKLSEDLVEQGADVLKALSRKIDTEKTNAPSFLAVVIATGGAYRRPDGIYVVPLTCLRN